MHNQPWHPRSTWPPALKAFIYVDDILAAAVEKRHICCLLAAIIEAIFTVCGQAMIEHRQYPLSLENGKS